MTKTSRLPGIAATALVLIFGNAIAADDAGAQPAQPDATNGPAQPANPPPKEDTPAKNNSSQNNTGKEEPGCD